MLSKKASLRILIVSNTLLFTKLGVKQSGDSPPPVSFASVAQSGSSC